MTKKTEQIAAEALAKFLELDGDEWEEIEDKGDGSFEYGRQEYLVLTDEEADQRCADEIRELLWAFNPSFLLSYMPEGLEEKDLKAIQERCESANPAIKALVGKQLDELIDDAVASDGRGHFLAQYDGEENKEGDFYIYRTN